MSVPGFSKSPGQEFVIIGAGPTGLSAAYWLARCGHAVTVLEASSAVGGLAASFEVGGVRVDHGSHRLHFAVDPRDLTVLREWLGSELQSRTRNGRIFLRGQWFRFPPRPGELLRRLPPAAVWASSLGRLAGRRRGRPASFEDEALVRTGEFIWKNVYRPYALKLWGRLGGELSPTLARQRVSTRGTVDLLRKMIPLRAHGHRFFYPAGGFGRICEALAEAAASLGAEIVTDARVTSIRTEPRLAVQYVDGRSGAERRVGACMVVSTLPQRSLVELLDLRPPRQVEEALGRLRHRGMVLVYVALSGRPWTNFDAHYVPDNAFLASRISEPINYRSSPHDPADRTVVCFEVPCDPGDAVWDGSSEELVGRIAADVVDLGLPSIAGRLEEVVVRKLSHVYPVQYVGFEDDQWMIETWLASLPGLVQVGRQPFFSGDNTHHCLAMGRSLAEAIDADGRLDKDRWRSCRHSFLSHVVED
ncbi:MAG: hypothetical protein KatS3mg008_1187 [Acidimicrobiales bacterium]|nr:MAG: hypothetical protein KatS3mg008_1187 [Acidimicrobiales bacterium]